MIMTAVRASPAPGILAQIFINLSRSDVRRDGDLIRLRIIFFCGKSHALLLLVDRRSHFCAEFMTADVCSECKFYLLEYYFRNLFRSTIVVFPHNYSILIHCLKIVRCLCIWCVVGWTAAPRRLSVSTDVRVATSPRSLPRTHLARLVRLQP